MKKKNESAMNNRRHLMFAAHWENGADDQIDIESWIRDILFTACEAAGAHIRSSNFETFFPCGMTAMVILAESHAVVSSWRENEEVLFDYFSCAEDPGFEKFIENVRSRGLCIDDDSVIRLDR